jgi:hypothetical protein
MKQIKKAYEEYIIWEIRKKSDDTGSGCIVQEDSGFSQAGLLALGLTRS